MAVCSLRPTFRFLLQLFLTLSYVYCQVSYPDFSNVSDPELTASSGTKFAATIDNGDIVLGGLFPVHKKSNRGYHACGEIYPDRGIQRLEAMLFAIDHINKNKDVLPDVTLGANILDTCSRDVYALEQSLEYVRASLSTLGAEEFQCKDGSPAEPLNAPTAVAGVIGGSYSGVSIQVANLLRLFKIPQISYASTSAALSDKSRFEYFARTVPPDNFQAKAMVDILQQFGWTYVSTISSEGDYGESGIDSFNEQARARNICIAVAEKVSQSAKERDFDAIIARLLEKPNARVIVLFLRGEDARDVLLGAQRRNMTNRFVWIASDGWGQQEMPVKDNQYVAQGALTIELTSVSLPEFDEYFMDLNPRNNKRNPWFKEYWEKIHNCQLPGDKNHFFKSGSDVATCTGHEKITRSLYKQETKIQFIFDAVYALAHALHNMLNDVCGHLRKKKKRKCLRMKRHNIDGDVLYNQYLLNVSFNDGYGGIVQFDAQGDGLGRYNVMNYRRNRSTGRYEYVTVGHWVNGLSMRPDQHIMWAGGTYIKPKSQCSEPCAHGQIKNMQQGDSCCWICTTCQPYEYVKDEMTCDDCGQGYWPFKNKTGCFELTEHYMQWDSLYAIVPICLSILGFALTSVVMVTFVRNFDTPIVKASGRELSFMLLSGFLVCYLMTFVLLAKPSALVCGVQRFGVGFGFSLTYASLLTKTNRISRIFDSASKSAKRPPFISPKSQVVITMILISVQVACTCVWLVFEPPGTRHYSPNSRRDDVVILKCRIKDVSFLIALVYNMLLIIICTVYAVKTRKIPENFNESKFIGFTMYTTCIIWLAFVPIYFGTLNSFQIQITTLCISISLSASVALLCLFTPKMYIIVFQPAKNVRRLTMNSGTYKKASSSISGTTANHGPPSEHIRLDSATAPLRLGTGAGGDMETDADRDSMASLENC